MLSSSLIFVPSPYVLFLPDPCKSSWLELFCVKAHLAFISWSGNIYLFVLPNFKSDFLSVCGIMASNVPEDEDYEVPDIVVPGNPTTWKMDIMDNQG